MRSARFWIASTLSLLTLGGVVSAWNAYEWQKHHQKKSQQNDSAQHGTPERTAMVGHRVTLIVTEGSVKKWRLLAEEATYNESRTIAHLKQVQGEFYNADGKPVLNFTAPWAIYTSENNTVQLGGGVVAHTFQSMVGAKESALSEVAQVPASRKNQDPETTSSDTKKGGEIQSPEMKWSAKEKAVVASGGVRLIFEQGNATAERCRFTLDFSKVTLLGHVSSSFMAL